MVDLEVQECKGLDPKNIYIISVKKPEDMNYEIFTTVFKHFRDQLDNLGLKYAINISNQMEIEISEIIPNNKFILNISNKEGDNI